MTMPQLSFGLRALLFILLLIQPVAAPAHEVLPSVADMTATGDVLTFDVRTNLEGLVAGIDLTNTADTNASSQAMQYDVLRALAPDALAEKFRSFWPAMSRRIHVQADGRDVPLSLVGVYVPETGDVTLERTSTISFIATLPSGTESVQVGWASQFGALVLRQMGVEDPYDGYLEGGALSAPIHLSGGDQQSVEQAFFSYIPVGFDHIVPQGLDHILFVLGLFFLSTRLSPLLWQISAFTLAHTVTLALGALGYVTVQSAIVEPIIAASITFVAVENILRSGLSRWRPLVVFAFGLLHGLGFAAVLGNIGLPDDGFFPALIGFNLGVELGQLFVIAAAFAAVGWFWRKPWYRARLSVPASAAIAAVGAFWCIQRMTGWGG